MNFDKWVENNWIQLSHNYNSRDISSPFEYFCEFIYVGLKNKCWLPIEYTYGIEQDEFS